MPLHENAPVKVGLGLEVRLDQGLMNRVTFILGVARGHRVVVVEAVSHRVTISCGKPKSTYAPSPAFAPFFAPAYTGPPCEDPMPLMVKFKYRYQRIQSS